LKAYVLGTAGRAGVRDEVDRWLPTLRSRFDVVVVDLGQDVDLEKQPLADVAFVFGGDGTILRAARQMRYRQVPVIGINVGRLGFLADLTSADVEHGLDAICRGDYRISKHLMYEASFRCGSEPATGTQTLVTPQTHLGMNEVTVHSPPPFGALDLILEVDHCPVAQFTGDGLIVSTPIGSTAYNLSAGGPILAQELDAFAVTPISPHTLTYRAIVESAENEFRISLGPRSTSALVILDGHETWTLGTYDCLTIRRAPVRFLRVKLPTRSYYRTLRDKLRWATPPEYRE
jgi:NAD+ kinase